MTRILPLIKLIRPQQWIKNTFLFLPIFFAGEFFDVPRMILVFLGLIAFSAASSAVYVLNDYKDIEADKIHPVKQYRPLASGVVSPGVGLVLMTILGLGGLALAYWINVQFCLLLVGYMLLNVMYSMGLKNVSIVDILIVATGFVLRTIAGGIIAGVYISHWLVIMIFLLSLFLVIAKRREDMLEYMASGKAIRKSIANYNLDFINLTITMLSGVIIVSYIMYTVSPDVNQRLHSNNLYVTSLFVITGLLRYMQITLVENKSGSPVRILYKDKFIHFTLIGWIVTFFLIIYSSRL